MRGVDPATVGLGDLLNSPAVQGILAGVPADLQTSAIVPNSFKGLGAAAGYEASTSDDLYMVDGGLANENSMPLAD